MEREFHSFRREVKADMELTQGLLRNTVKRLDDHEKMILALMQHQLEMGKDFRSIDSAFGKVRQGVDNALNEFERAMTEKATKAELAALEARIRALENKGDAA